MALSLVGVAVLAVVFGVSGASSLSSPLTPLEAARMAVEDFNAEAAAPAVFRLLKLRNTHKTRFGWGIHFSMNFSIKETHCQKTSSYRMGDCKYKPNGAVQDCSAEISVLSFLQDSPLASVKCRRTNAGGRKTKPIISRPQAMEAAGPPRVQVEYYFPSSFSTAALMANEEEE